MFKVCYLKLVGFVVRTDINVIRMVAAIYFLNGIVGLLWYADIVFSGKYLFDTAISTIPLLSLLVGIITPVRWLQNKLYLIFYQAVFIIGMLWRHKTIKCTFK